MSHPARCSLASEKTKLLLLLAIANSLLISGSKAFVVSSTNKTSNGLPGEAAAIIASSIGASPSTKTTIAPVNAIAAAAINDAVKQTGALTNVSSAIKAIDATLTTAAPAFSVSIGGGTAGPVIVGSASNHTDGPKHKPDVVITSSLPGAAQTTQAPVVVTVVAGSTTSPQNAVSKKLDDYFEPICEQLQKLNEKQHFKIQAQLKKFVGLTNGKLSVCFAQQYAIDPNLTPVTKAQLELICSSRKEPANSNKVQFKTFETCVNQNWEPALDKELERIVTVRANCAKHHPHSKNDTSVSVTHEDGDDEISVISNVLKTVLGGGDGTGSPSSNSTQPVTTSDIKLLDFGASPAPIVAATTIKPLAITNEPISHTTPAPVVVNLSASAGPSSAAPLVVSTKAINATLLVSTPPSTGSSTAAPVVAVTFNSNNHTTMAPDAKLASATTTHPFSTPVAAAAAAAAAGAAAAAAPLGASPSKVADAAASGAKAALAIGSSTTTLAPAHANSTASAISNITTSGIMNDPNTVVVFVDEPGRTTPAPAIGNATHTAAPATSVSPTLAAKLVASVSVSASTTTAKPKNKTTSSTTAMAASKTAAADDDKHDKDDHDTKKAIASLKAQRSHGHGSAADERMHQIEHERQMSIDPVGHSLKHKIYEMKKDGKKP